tara:strand:- start:471 stop:704 length:234 start_codon:yes stop_codon:yes gene_type:complete
MTAKSAPQHPDKQSLIIASTWSEIQPISERVRQRLQAEGQVGDENIRQHVPSVEIAVTSTFRLGIESGSVKMITEQI